jgi:hypothetical protein
VISQRHSSDHAAITQRLRSDSAAITKRFHSDFTAISQRFHSDFAAISQRFRSCCFVVSLYHALLPYFVSDWSNVTIERLDIDLQRSETDRCRWSCPIGPLSIFGSPTLIFEIGIHFLQVAIDVSFTPIFFFVKRLCVAYYFSAFIAFDIPTTGSARLFPRGDGTHAFPDSVRRDHDDSVRRGATE